LVSVLDDGKELVWVGPVFAKGKVTLMYRIALDFRDGSLALFVSDVFKIAIATAPGHKRRAMRLGLPVPREGLSAVFRQAFNLCRVKWFLSVTEKKNDSSWTKSFFRET
jgi:hypothetical protein